jgi:hypothetical protein
MSESIIRLSVDVVFSIQQLVAPQHLRDETNTGFVLLLDKGWGKFWEDMTKFCINFEENLWRAYDNFEHQNKDLKPSKTIIN